MKKAIIIIVAILLAGGAVAFALTRDNKKKESSSSSTNSSTQSDSHESSDETTSEGGQDQAESVAGDTEVEIEDFAFGPETITVKKGTTVTWTNKDSAAHTVTPDEESDAFIGSELLAQDESYSFTFNEVGTYTYHCQPHPQMTAKVVVTE
jgi:amicyanin